MAPNIPPRRPAVDAAIGAQRRPALRWLAAEAIAPSPGHRLDAVLHPAAGQFGVVLALFAGFFLYLGASDLIPESYHGHPKVLTTAMTLAGAAVLYLAVRLAGG